MTTKDKLDYIFSVYGQDTCIIKASEEIDYYKKMVTCAREHLFKPSEIKEMSKIEEKYFGVAKKTQKKFKFVDVSSTRHYEKPKKAFFPMVIKEYKDENNITYWMHKPP